MGDGTKTFDDVLSLIHTGQWTFLYFVLCGYWGFFAASGGISGIFMTPAMNYTCLPPIEVNVTYISEDSCSYFVNSTLPDGETSSEEVPCTKWEFDKSIFQSTMTSEFNLVCGRASMRATYMSLAYLGSIFGTPLIGVIADRYGRKKLAILGQVTYSLLYMGFYFATNFYLILVMRFFLGCVGATGIYMLAIEVCELKYRYLAGILLGIPHSFGSMTFGLLAYYIRSWRTLQFFMSFPLCLAYVGLYCIDESPRWLIINGHTRQALKVLKRAAKMNKATLPPDEEIMEMFSDIQIREMKLKALNEIPKELRDKKWWQKLRLPVIIRTPQLRKTVLLLAFQMLGLNTVASSIVLGADTLKVDRFLYHIFGALIDVPNHLITACVVKCFGRRIPHTTSMISCSIFSLIIAFTPKDGSQSILVMALISKVCLGMAYTITWGHLAEMLPTQVRLQAMGALVAFEHIGATCVPYITNYVGLIVPWLPSLMISIICFEIIGTMLPLPDTLGKPMIETVDEFEVLAYNREKGMDLVFAEDEEVFAEDEEVFAEDEEKSLIQESDSCEN